MKRKRTLVSSNCQTDTLAEAMQVLLPGHDVSFIHRPSDSTDTGYLGEELISGVDFLVTSDPRCFDSSSRLAEPDAKIIRIPTVEFAAFHPDIVYAKDPSCNLLRCLDSDYHSALVLWGWKNRLGVEQILPLFCEKVFYHVGYLNSWNVSVAKLKDKFDACGLEFTSFWRSVKRDPVFMHSINHPKVLALSELSKQIAIKLGADERVLSEPIHELLTDQLSAIRWPVYPEVGKLLGVKGMYKWKIRKAKYLTLEDYVTEAVRSYDEKGLGRDEITFHSLGYEQLNLNLRQILGMSQ